MHIPNRISEFVSNKFGNCSSAVLWKKKIFTHSHTLLRVHVRIFIVLTISENRLPLLCFCFWLCQAKRFLAAVAICCHWINILRDFAVAVCFGKSVLDFWLKSRARMSIARFVLFMSFYFLFLLFFVFTFCCCCFLFYYLWKLFSLTPQPI